MSFICSFMLFSHFKELIFCQSCDFSSLLLFLLSISKLIPGIVSFWSMQPKLERVFLLHNYAITQSDKIETTPQCPLISNILPFSLMCTLALFLSILAQIGPSCLVVNRSIKGPVKLMFCSFFNAKHQLKPSFPNSSIFELKCHYYRAVRIGETHFKLFWW